MKPPEETGAPAPEVKPVTASELLIDLPPAAPSPAAPAAPENAPPAGELDSLKRPYDATKFRPEKDTAGRWKNRNAGRRKAAPGAPAPAAPSGPPIPEIGPEETKPGGTPPPAPGAGTPPPPAGAPGAARDATLAPEAGGNLLARVLYKITGTFTGDHKKAVATGAEHKAIADTFGAFLSFRGIALSGGLAVVATVVAYLLDDSRGESVFDAFKRRFFKAKPGDTAKRAEPTAAPVTVAATAPARPVAPDSPAAHHVRFPSE